MPKTLDPWQQNKSKNFCQNPGPKTQEFIANLQQQMQKVLRTFGPVNVESRKTYIDLGLNLIFCVDLTQETILAAGLVQFTHFYFF